MSSSVADPDPGSGAFLIPGSGIRNRFFLATKFSSSLSFLAVFGSGIRDPGSEIRDPGSEIRDPGSESRDPGWVKIRIRDLG